MRKNGHNTERMLWSVLGALARMGFMMVFVLIACFATIMSFDSGFSFKNLLNAIVINLLLEGFYLLLIWGWTPKWQRPWWIVGYTVVVVIELMLLCFG